MLPDGTKALSHVTTQAVIITRNGNKLRVGDLAYAPTSKNNLLSTAHLTRNNHCSVLLGPNGGAIIAGQVDLTDMLVIEHLRLMNGTYTVDARPEPQKGTVNNISLKERKHAGIMAYFRKRETVRPPKPVRPVSLRVLEQRTGQPHATVDNSKNQVRTIEQPSSTMPSYLLDIPKSNRCQVEAAHRWHLRLNHTAPEKIRVTAGMPTVKGVTVILKSGLQPINCSECAVGHTQKVPHRMVTEQAPPGTRWPLTWQGRCLPHPTDTDILC